MRTRPTPGTRGRRLRPRTAVAGLAAALVGASVLLPVASAPASDPDVAAAPGLTLSLPAPAADASPATTADDRRAQATGATGATGAAATGTAAPAGPAPAPREASPAGTDRDADDPDGTRPGHVDAPATTTQPLRSDDTAPDPAAGGTGEAEAPAGDRTRPTAPGVVTGTLVRVWAEQHVEPGGTAVHAADDGRGTGPDEAGARLQSWVETPGTAYPVPPTDVVGVADGSTVTVDLAAPPATGAPHPVRRLLEVAAAQQVEGAVTFGEGSTDVFGIASAAVVHDVTVVLAVPRGAQADSATPDQVAASVTGGVNTYWTRQSRSQRSVRVVAKHGWQTLGNDCSDAFKLWDEVAAKVGWTGGARKHLLVYLPSDAGCGAGLGTVGAGPDSGGRSWVSINSVSIIAHELGHNFGLGHSDGLLCTGSSDGTWTGNAWQSGCAGLGYRDYYDVMGVSWSNLGSLAAPHADALGLLRSTEQLVTAEPVRVHLAPASGDGLRVLRVDDPDGVYYVEYRPAAGWDAWLSDNYKGLDAGVIVHRRDPKDARKALLLDGSLSAGPREEDWRSALAPGTSLTTASGTTRIAVESQDETGATLVVHRDGRGPEPVQPPEGGAQVEIRTPEVAAAATGPAVFRGVATAPEGTLLWEVTEDGVTRASGTAATGVNGEFDTFWVPVQLPAGDYTFRAWVPDESDGEGDVDRALLEDEVSVSRL
ncbi:Gmad2 immunoglobulin-like domain-containing protein [Jannaschia sp. R86511]|uniref:Gmad2 immunoglobulin-like domain-containing protein n=1 Tax=Jannaschia sp. R86511 TaxID=3093853 RepID=UPI0036D27ECB